MKENNTVFIGLGSNIANRKEYLDKALKNIQKYVKIYKKSSIYETEPVDYENQEDFLNQVIEAKTKLHPNDLLRKIQEIEVEMGRKRKTNKGPRKIDIDILFYNHRIIKDKDLMVPHPLVQERAFILVPLNEINPKFKHPIFRKNAKNLLKNLKNKKIVKKWT